MASWTETGAGAAGALEGSTTTTGGLTWGVFPTPGVGGVGNVWERNGSGSIISVGGNPKGMFVDCGSNNVEIEIERVDNANPFILLRYSDVDNWLGIYAINGYVKLIKKEAGSAVAEIHNFGAISLTNSDRFSGGVGNDNVYYVKKNGSATGTPSAAVSFNQAATKHGFGSNHASTATLVDMIGTDLGASVSMAAGVLTKTAHDEDSVSFTWTAAQDNTGTVTEQLQVSEHDADDWSNVSGATSSPATATGLDPGTVYDFRVSYTDSLTTVYSDTVLGATKDTGGSGVNVVCVGDSNTYGTNATTGQGTATGNTYPGQLATALGGGYTVHNIGVGGWQIPNLIEDKTEFLDPLFNVDCDFNVACVMIGTNDLGTGGTPAATKAELDPYIASLRADGWKVIVATLFSNNYSGNDIDDEIIDYNALILADTDLADAIADIGSDPDIGPPDNHDDTTYFAGDKVHLIDAGLGIVAGYFEDAIIDLVTVATAYTLDGPDTAHPGVAITLTVEPNGDWEEGGTVTLAFSGVAGAWDGDNTPTWAAEESGAKTVDFIPSGTGTLIISATNNGGLTDPASLEIEVVPEPATSYTLTGPSSGRIATPATFIVTPNGPVDGGGTVTLSDGGGDGDFADATLTWTDGESGAKNTTYTKPTVGMVTISATNDAGLDDPENRTFNATEPAEGGGSASRRLLTLLSRR